jgi:hypothetical protein
MPKQRNRRPPARSETHDQVWAAAVTGCFLIFVVILQYLLAGWPLLGH